MISFLLFYLFLKLCASILQSISPLLQISELAVTLQNVFNISVHYTNNFFNLETIVYLRLRFGLVTLIVTTLFKDRNSFFWVGALTLYFYIRVLETHSFEKGFEVKINVIFRVCVYCKFKKVIL